MSYGYNKRGGGMVTSYNKTSSRTRGQDYNDGGYDTSNSRSSSGRRDYRQVRSISPNRRRNSRGGDRDRSPHQFHERVYDDFAARDYNNYEGSSGGGGGYYHDDRGGYERDHARDTVRDYRETYERDDRLGERDRRSQRYNRESRRDDRSVSRDRYRDRDPPQDSRDYQDNRDNSRDRRDNRDSRVRGSSRDNRDKQVRENRDRHDQYEDSQSHSDRGRRRENDHIRNDDVKDDNIERTWPPSSTVILQNVGSKCTEGKIQAHLKTNGITYSSVAVIRERTGENKGYAFVEFEDINTAEKWLKLTKRNIVIDGQSILLNFSRSRKNDPNNIPDWNCIKCNILNFGSRRRNDKKATCYKCGSAQNDSDNTSQDNIINNNKEFNEVLKVEPCNVLMIRGMDFTTTEEVIRNALGALTTCPIYDVRLIRDKFTDMSRGFAFIEMGSVEDATGLLETIENSDPPFEIVERRIVIGYARHGYNAPLSGKKLRTGSVVSQAAENVAHSVKSIAEYSHCVVGSYMNAALANHRVADATAVALSTANAGVAAAAAGAAVPASYSYDPTSGYYFDSSTNLYYDPNTGYYYNSTTGKWLFWNGSRYQAVNQDGTPVTTAHTQAAAITATATPVATTENNVSSTTEFVTEEQKKPMSEVAVSFQKPKTARKIAKDMERWAKKMNIATEARKVAVKQAQEELKLLAIKEEELRQQLLQETTSIFITEVNTAPKDNIRSLFVPDNDDEGSVLKLGSALVAVPSEKPRATARVTVAEIPDDDDFVDESKFVDLNKMACLLCKRQFPSKDVLTKHLQMSQLHKESLEKYKKSKEAR